jgi:hypothetical protein
MVAQIPDSAIETDTIGWNGWKPQLVTPALDKGPKSSADPNLFCTLSSMSFDFGYYLGEGDR